LRAFEFFAALRLNSCLAPDPLGWELLVTHSLALLTFRLKNGLFYRSEITGEEPHFEEIAIFPSR
jgi:hypothetical protein